MRARAGVDLPEAAAAALRELGLPEELIQDLASSEKGLDCIHKQLEWLPYRAGLRNRGAFFRKAVVGMLNGNPDYAHPPFEYLAKQEDASRAEKRKNKELDKQARLRQEIYKPKGNPKPSLPEDVAAAYGALLAAVDPLHRGVLDGFAPRLDGELLVLRAESTTSMELVRKYRVKIEAAAAAAGLPGLRWEGKGATK